MRKLVFISILGLLMGITGSSPASAIFGLGCSDAQKKAPALARQMASYANLEMTNYKKYQYRTAYANYVKTVKAYAQWYGLVTSKRKCFNGDASISSTIKTMSTNYSSQKSMCDRYGMEICKMYVKTYSDPCSEYKYNVFDYQSCMEDQARDTGGSYVD